MHINTHISMDTLARICETLNCEITGVIELVPEKRRLIGTYGHFSANLSIRIDSGFKGCLEPF